MLGQVHHFVKFNPDASAYASERFAKEAKRLYGVLNQRLDRHAYLAGDDYSIADIATWPWVSRFEGSKSICARIQRFADGTKTSLRDLLCSAATMCRIK
jgi:glutathione S-transferase